MTFLVVSAFTGVYDIGASALLLCTATSTYRYSFDPAPYFRISVLPYFSASYRPSHIV